MLSCNHTENGRPAAHLIEVRCLEDRVPFDAKAVAALLVGRDEDEIRTGRDGG